VSCIAVTTTRLWRGLTLQDSRLMCAVCWTGQSTGGPWLSMVERLDQTVRLCARCTVHRMLSITWPHHFTNSPIMQPHRLCSMLCAVALCCTALPCQPRINPYCRDPPRWLDIYVM
jgi:hypothetical protein